MRYLKAVTYYLPVFLVCISLFSCSDNSVHDDTGKNFEIRAWDYSDKHYFLDTVYKNSFQDFYDNQTISNETNLRSVNQETFEIWVQTDGSIASQRFAALHVDLPQLPATGDYNDSLINFNPVQGQRNYGMVRKLSLSEYTINRIAGFVSLKINLQDNLFAGVAYQRVSGERFGTISTDSTIGPSDTLVLKMIKVQNLVPQNTEAWEMKLKNIYQLPKTPVAQEGFEFRITYLYNEIHFPTLPGFSTFLITMLKLDRYTTGMTGNPNSQFDFLPGYTIDTQNGWIIFPSLKPFLTDLQNYNAFGQTVNPQYWYPEIYNGLKHSAMLSGNANKYLLSGYVP